MSLRKPPAGRRFFAPEVVQTSSMDCGPAVLKCLVEGFGTPVNYGRLREACQTEVDGTSIDTIEAVARQLGLDAEQIMLPVDHLFLQPARALPGLVVLVRPSGLAHFAVVWSQHGSLLQVMDPARGRRWVRESQFRPEVLIHSHRVPASGWREWAASPDFTSCLGHRLRSLGTSGAFAARAIEKALEDPGWRAIATLDAATRMARFLRDEGSIGTRTNAAEVVRGLVEASLTGTKERAVIPAHFWSVFSPHTLHGVEHVVFRGAVLVRVRGRRTAAGDLPTDTQPSSGKEPDRRSDLAAALRAPPERVWRDLVTRVRADGAMAPALVLVGVGIAAGLALFETFLFRGVIEIGHSLSLPNQRLGALVALLVLVSARTAFMVPLALLTARIGRSVEARFRRELLRKIARLHDRYFESRPVSDVAERAHRVQQLKALPGIVAGFWAAACSLLLTVAGISWLDSSSGPLALVAAAAGIGIPLASLRLVSLQTHRFQTHNGALMRVHLDALLGAVPIRAHGAAGVLRGSHQDVMREWLAAGHRLVATRSGVNALGSLIQYSLVAWLVTGHLGVR